MAERGITHIDLLSIDTEGTEIDVWRSIGSHRPVVVIVEFNTVGLPDNTPAIMTEFEACGYVLRHRTEANLIFKTR